ncbi:MAG: LPS-assembly protein LptD [Halomonas sp.]|uniref:LPS-assembly protein LptD n=1 Tax=Halomonas sp. TaxID=1486246 RepID=UPI0017F4EDD8|nr:LPS-assembly protein LptD [Halomonas sp.]NWN82090.1 LPS-assembly protein LptD [Halomonas sp.]
MGKRLSWTALAGLATAPLAGAPLLAAPPEPLPAEQLDFMTWGEERPADALCRGRYVMPDYRLPPPEPGQVASESASAHYGDDGETLLQGEVVLRRDTAQLETPEARVPPSRERAFAEGPLTLRDQGLLVRGGAGELSLVHDGASIDEAHYVVHEQRLRGDAERLARLEDGRYQLTSGSFTTCDPGNNLWRLVGGDVVLDRESGFGTARHARLEVKDVPVFYWPWVRFPIDDRRQTGFLWPAVGFSTDSLDYAQPFYWNIAPDQDATITPRWISDRGLLLGGQYRYLFPSDAGQIEGAWLGSDDGGDSDNPNDAARRFEGEDRWYLDYRHAGTLDSRTRYRLRYGAASDGRYFDDFGSDFAEQNTSSMSRLAQIDYRGDTWRLDARAQGFQKLDDPLQEQDKPFYRLPSLSASARWSQASGFYQQWQSNYSYFWRDVEENEITLDREAATGSRLHLSPALGWRLDASWGHLEPRFEWLGTAYELDYGERDVGDRDTRLTRSVPVTSVDAGLVFERELDLGGRDYRQTLEPRANYAYVPARDQSDFPDFDTSERAFSWNQLWSPYRFSGSDRVGDLNRLSLGVSSRLLEDEGGRQRLSLGLGQAFYFEDRVIDMNGDPDSLPDSEHRYADWYRATRERSPLVVNADWQISERWRTYWEWLYDDHRERTERTGVDLQYRSPQGHALNLGYRWELEGFDPSLDRSDDDFREYDREEYDVSFAWKAGRRFDVIGRLLYDNTNDRALEQLAGVQWNDCCYGVQLVWREWIDDNDTGSVNDDFSDRGVFLRFVFKGLGGVGREADSYFEEAIPGYRSTAF